MVFALGIWLEIHRGWAFGSGHVGVHIRVVPVVFIGDRILVSLADVAEILLYLLRLQSCHRLSVSWLHLMVRRLDRGLREAFLADLWYRRRCLVVIHDRMHLLVPALLLRFENGALCVEANHRRVLLIV